MPSMIFSDLNLECAMRIVVACLCGGVIGIERTKRHKGAGIRTHMIVAMGAAVFVIVSKYGFNDIVYIEGAGVDISRVASNIVTGIGFLGAGIIFMRGDSIQGLTTAAGIWVTAAVGLSVGAGMYILGIFCAILVLIVQVMMHRGFVAGMENVVRSRIVVNLPDDPDEFKKVKIELHRKNIKIVGSHVKRRKDSSLTYTLDVQMPRNYTSKDVLALIREYDQVKSIGM